MDALSFITETLSLPTLRDFLSENVPGDLNNLDLIVVELIDFQIFIKGPYFRWIFYGSPQAIIDGVQLTANKLANFMSEIVRFASRKESSSSGSHDLVKDWKETLDLIFSIVVMRYNLIESAEYRVDHLERRVDIDAVMNSLNIIKISENMLLEIGDSSNCITLNEEESQALLLMKAIPALGELKESSKILNFLLKLSKELHDLPQLICKACKGKALALLLLGIVLSFKPTTYDAWNRVKDGLGCISSDKWPIFYYCYDDLPYFLKSCFLYFACYPIGYEIPAATLTKIWIAEGFVTPEKGETWVETANKYLEQLVQRSFVCVSKRSFSGTIKSCRVPRSIHEFAIHQSYREEFLAINLDQGKLESPLRLAIHHDNNNQYTEVKNNYMRSFIAFNLDRNVIGSVVFLRVLELRKSAIPVTTLPYMIYLQYLGLRGSSISELPENIGDIKNLQTLDVRDTGIETLPESLWNISVLRHVYVTPSPQIKGPPSASNISDLQILKTVVAHESWLEKIPHFLIHLRKLGLSNWDDLFRESTSDLLRQMDKLISMIIIGNIVPSEFVDTRAFPNLETVKSIKLEGKWTFWKLPIDNVQFPPNLTKLTLTKSSLREDPMPTLERLQALKFLSLQDEAYTGMKMVCSAKGFPQLQFLELSKLDNLITWEVEPTAMPQLSRLRVDQCSKLNNLPNLHCVIVNNIND